MLPQMASGLFGLHGLHARFLVRVESAPEQLNVAFLAMVVWRLAPRESSLRSKESVQSQHAHYVSNEEV